MAAAVAKETQNTETPSFSENDKWPNEPDDSEDTDAENADQDDADLDDEGEAQDDPDDDADDYSAGTQQDKKDKRRKPDAESRIAELTAQLRQRDREIEGLQPHVERAKRFANTLSDFEKGGHTDDAALSDAALRMQLNNELQGENNRIIALVNSGDISLDEGQRMYQAEIARREYRLSEAQRERKLAAQQQELEDEKRKLRSLRYETVLEKSAAKYGLPEYAVERVRRLVSDPDKVEESVKDMADLIKQTRGIAKSGTKPARAASDSEHSERSSAGAAPPRGSSATSDTKPRSGADMSLSEAFNATVARMKRRGGR